MFRPWEATRGKRQREPASERDGHQEFSCGEARHFLACAWTHMVKQKVARGYQWRLCSATEAEVVAVGRQGTQIELREESGGKLKVRASNTSLEHKNEPALMFMSLTLIWLDMVAESIASSSLLSSLALLSASTPSAGVAPTPPKSGSSASLLK